jgi:hypothetical protein
MKILKAKKNYLNKQTFQISDLTYITRMTPLKELLNGEDMIEPIKVLKHDKRKNPIGPSGEELFDYSKYRSGAGDSNFKEKEYSVWEGNQRVQAAIQLGYTHIEGIIVNE